MMVRRWFVFSAVDPRSVTSRWGAPDRIWVRADEHSELHQPSLHGCVGAWGARQEASSAGSFFGHDVVRIGEVAVAQ